MEVPSLRSLLGLTRLEAFEQFLEEALQPHMLSLIAEKKVQIVERPPPSDERKTPGGRKVGRLEDVFDVSLLSKIEVISADDNSEPEDDTGAEMQGSTSNSGGALKQGGISKRGSTSKQGGMSKQGNTSKQGGTSKEHSAPKTQRKTLWPAVKSLPSVNLDVSAAGATAASASTSTLSLDPAVGPADIAPGTRPNKRGNDPEPLKDGPEAAKRRRTGALETPL